MKRIVPFILLFVALLLHGTEIHAQKLSLLESNTTTSFVSVDGVDVDRISENRVKVKIKGLRTMGSLHRNSDPNCIATGLEGSDITTKMDLMVLVDIIGRKQGKYRIINGRVVGDMEMHSPTGVVTSYRVRGQVIRGPVNNLSAGVGPFFLLSYSASLLTPGSSHLAGMRVDNLKLGFIPGQGGCSRRSQAPTDSGRLLLPSPDPSMI